VDIIEPEKISPLFYLANKQPILWSTDAALVLTSGPCLTANNEMTQADHWIGKDIFEYIGTRDMNHPLIRMHLTALNGEMVNNEYQSLDSTFITQVHPLISVKNKIIGCIGMIFKHNQTQQETNLKQYSKNIMAMPSLEQEAGFLNTFSSLVRDEERARIARELHDELGQMLTALKMDLSFFQQQFESTRLTHESANQKISKMSHLIDSCIESVRQTAKNIRIDIVGITELIEAIKRQAQELEQRADVVCVNEFHIAECCLEPQITTVIYRIAQEAYTNIARHAQAKNVFTTLNVEKSHISLTIKDDGIGLPAKILANPTSLGIIGMQERASLVNGKLKISSSHDKGTTIQLTIPMEITYIQCIQDE